ncbi:transcription factor Adf-1-like [Belonocnema kinseyi]|uniref:transcription factor Adf-1-like n=1 Tax=Belonocnema kinseyi TaxID=2817044 RepID=UPI00143DB6F2|nr:transcription factor Adf-1-like [Belonocnema kinseyi]
MDDSKLIELVRHRSCLFDPKNKYYKDLNVRDDAWAEIAEGLKQPVEECKSRWRNVRDTFMRRKRSQKISTGSARSRKRRRWFLEGSLDFLHQVENEKATAVPANSGDLDSDEEPKSQTEETEIEEPIYNNENAETLQLIEEHLITIKEEDIDKRKHEENTSSRRKQKVTDTILETIGKNSNERQEFLSKVFESKTEDDHPIDVFFKSMAESVKKMSQERQIRAKMQVFQIIGQLELEELNSRPSSTFLSYYEQSDSRPTSSGSS